MSLNVYYLDDEETLLEIFTDYFSGTDIHVKIFESPAEFLKTCEESPPDIVFLDFRMPGTTGDLVASKLPPSLAKVLITGELDVSVQSKFTAIFEKPIHFDEVDRFLKEFAAKPAADLSA